MKEKNAQVWLCILNAANFEVLEKKRIYGVPNNTRALNQLKNVRRGDILLFYVTSPTKRILGISKATSSMFEEKKMTPWKDRLYPYRIRISEITKINVPLKKFVGVIDGIKTRIPMGASLILLRENDLETIRSLATTQSLR